MTKGERLIWDLFMKVREVLPATADNSKWATEWAAMFHEMEQLETPPAVEPRLPSADDHAEDDAEDDDGGDDDVPHVRAAPKRTKRK